MQYMFVASVQYQHTWVPQCKGNKQRFMCMPSVVLHIWDLNSARHVVDFALLLDNPGMQVITPPRTRQRNAHRQELRRNHAIVDQGATSSEPAGTTLVSSSNRVCEQTASFSRILVAGTRPNARFRSVPTRVLGPFGLAVLAAYSTSLAIAAYRNFIVKRTRACCVCAGFGVNRCDFCDGVGAVQWEGKWGHVEPCPRCVGRRHIRCEACGGLYHRAMFAHVPRMYGSHSPLPPIIETVSATEEVIQTKQEIIADY
jgi:hypothetical protein